MMSEQSGRKTYRRCTSSRAGFRARTSAPQASAQGCTHHAAVSSSKLEGSLRRCGLRGSFLKMCRVCFPRKKVPTSGRSSKRLPNAGTAWRGEFWTANISESPNDAEECSLSDVLESHVPQRFFLSVRAATGILRRSARRGKELPLPLRVALQAIATRPVGDAKTTSISFPLSASRISPPSLLSHAITPETTAQAVHHPQSLIPCDQKIMRETQAKLFASRHDIRETGAALRLQSYRRSRQDRAAQGREMRRRSCVAPTLSTQSDCSGSAKTRLEWMIKCAELTARVRRLTPTECEILQAFPKGWTVPATEHWATRSRCPLRTGSRRESK